jgi:hypothetical protein
MLLTALHLLWKKLPKFRFQDKLNIKFNLAFEMVEEFSLKCQQLISKSNSPDFSRKRLQLFRGFRKICAHDNTAGVQNFRAYSGLLEGVLIVERKRLV